MMRENKDWLIAEASALKRAVADDNFSLFEEKLLNLKDKDLFHRRLYNDNEVISDKEFSQNPSKPEHDSMFTLHEKLMDVLNSAILLDRTEIILVLTETLTDSYLKRALKTNPSGNITSLWRDDVAHKAIKEYEKTLKRNGENKYSSHINKEDITPYSEYCTEFLNKTFSYLLRKDKEQKNSGVSIKENNKYFLKILQKLFPKTIDAAEKQRQIVVIDVLCDKVKFKDKLVSQVLRLLKTDNFDDESRLTGVEHNLDYHDYDRGLEDPKSFKDVLKAIVSLLNFSKACSFIVKCIQKIRSYCS